MNQDAESGPIQNPSEGPCETSVERRAALKIGLGLVPILVTVPSRPAWAGYASLDPNYGAESQSG